MVTRKKDIDTIIAHLDAQYDDIKRLYHESLRSKKIEACLVTALKNYAENALCVLNICAQDIIDVYELAPSMIEFPLITNDDSFKGIKNREKVLEKYVPGLKEKNPNLFRFLESIQPYHLAYTWLAQIDAVVTHAYYDRLAPQIQRGSGEWADIRFDGRIPTLALMAKIKKNLPVITHHIYKLL